jgi:hypothetical protein
MTRYRPRVVLLLFLVPYLTACATSWQSVAAPSPAQLIEAEQPDRVRVTLPNGTKVELEEPSVEGDELVGRVNESSFWCRAFLGGYTRAGEAYCDRFAVRSIPLADIFMLELRKPSGGRTALAVLPAVLLVVLLYHRPLPIPW